MDCNKLISKTYSNTWKLAIGMILYIFSPNIFDPTYKLIATITYFSLFGLVLFDLLLFYFFEAKKKFYKNKIKFIFISTFILFVILSYVLFLLIGFCVAFYTAVFTGLIAYIFSLAAVLSNHKRKNKR